MQRDQRGKVLRVALVSGSLILIVVGLAIGLAGGWFGWLIAGLGVLDAVTIPFVLRVVEGRRSGAATAAPVEPTAWAGPEAADPSHNPYARED